MSLRAWADARWARGSPLPDNRKCEGNNGAGRQESGSGKDSREAGESIKKTKRTWKKNHKNGRGTARTQWDACVCLNGRMCWVGMSPGFEQGGYTGAGKDSREAGEGIKKNQAALEKKKTTRTGEGRNGYARGELLDRATGWTI